MTAIAQQSPPASRPVRPASGSSDEGYRRHQLLWFTWIRLAVITTALVTTLVFDLVARPERASADAVQGVYVVLLGGYVLAAGSLVALAVTRSDVVLAAVQFAGDLVLETALFFVLVPVLGTHDGAVALVMPLFVLTTALACTYLDRFQGATFATCAFLLQVAAHLLPRTPVLGWLGLPAHELADLSLAQVARNLFVLMFTFHATAWLLSSRSERLKAVGRRLKTVSEDLAELQAFNEMVVRNVSAALVTTDLDGRITFANEAARNVVGSDARGMALHDLLGWQEHREQDLSSLLAGRAPRRFAREGTLDGRRLSLEVAASILLDGERRALGLLFLIEDRTELRALEQEVRLHEKMAVVGEMAAGIAHEIRNPLASISGSVQILQRQLQLGEDQKKLMGIVLDEARRLDGTIRDFLDFARPREPRRRTVDIAELARETLLLLGHGDLVLPSHVLSGPSVGSAPAWCDPDQLRQVLWNLCQNALKAMPEGGRLSVDVATASREVVLVVEDTGVGMSEQMKARAFEPLAGEFARGTGLGLAIVYRIVQEHGGRVSLQSARGRGTRIEVRLPSAIPDQAQAEGASA